MGRKEIRGLSVPLFKTDCAGYSDLFEESDAIISREVFTSQYTGLDSSLETYDRLQLFD